MRIHQLLSGAGPHDAITSEAISFRARFRQWQWGGKDYAVHVAPGLNGHIRMLKRFKPQPDDVLLLHHSAGAPRLRELLALPNRKLLLYHNVTPAPWFWEHAPNVAVQCAVGREQLPALVRAVDVAAADSAFNAAELEAAGATRTAVIPLLVDYGRLGAPTTSAPTGPPTVLFVGRLSPHKHQDEVIRAFALYRRHRAPDARLILVGDPISSRYLDFLRGLAESLAPGAVSIESGLSNEELGDRYRAAHVFLCLSAHEGFCIPILEAFSQGVPVIARPAGAIPETTGDGAILVEDPDLAVVAELLHLAVTDAELRAELRRRGEARVALHSPDRVAERLRAAVQAVTRG
ncbi:MAG TPA: glycosyltransferase family 4 protein [Solirubrobacteraceae bacterium]|nr:glycosyltransferase family 4 protein [Solirubrobacteraceae bacterium]